MSQPFSSSRAGGTNRLLSMCPALALGLGLVMIGSELLGAEAEAPATKAPAEHAPLAPHSAPATAELSPKPAQAVAGKVTENSADPHQSLRGSRGLFPSSNLRPPSPKRNELPPPNYKLLLEQALDQKRGKNLAEAEKLLIRLLEAPAPDELHKTALLELAVLAHERQELPRAQQIYAQ